MSHPIESSGSPPDYLPLAAETLPDVIAADESSAEGIGRRGFLGLAVKALLVTGAAEVSFALAGPQPAETEAETGPQTARTEGETQPTDPNEPDNPAKRPSKPPTPEDLRQAQIDALNSEKRRDDSERKLLDVQRREIEGRLQPPSLLQQIGKNAEDILTTLGITAGVGTVIGACVQYFGARKKDRENTQEAMRIEEDTLFRGVTEKISIAIDKVKAAEDERAQRKWRLRPPPAVSYTQLHRAYQQLQLFTSNPRYSNLVASEVTTLLRDRAKALPKMTPSQIEDRVNADRELVIVLSLTAPHLPPTVDKEENIVLPNAAGISLNHMRFLRQEQSLEGLNLEGAYLQNLLITGSLAGSRFKLAHLDGSTFGAPGEVCDLRGTDLSRADLKDATFANILIDADTKFGEGEEGNPSARFGNVISDGSLTDTQIEEKVQAAQDIIDAWQKKHPDVELVIPTQRRPQTRLAKLLQVVGVSPS